MMMHVQSVEKENAELKRERYTLTGDTDAVTTEKRHIQIALETALNEKNRLADRLNHLTIIGELYCKQSVICHGVLICFEKFTNRKQ